MVVIYHLFAASVPHFAQGGRQTISANSFRNRRFLTFVRVFVQADGDPGGGQTRGGAHPFIGIDDAGDKDRGRDAYCYAPTAQSRTCGFPAYGFHLGYLTAKR
jgi:hypothetical protein